jgi:capsid protein
VLLISEADLDQAVYEEHGEDHRQKQRHVLAEKRPVNLTPATHLHKIRKRSRVIGHPIASSTLTQMKTRSRKGDPKLVIKGRFAAIEVTYTFA